MDQNSKGKIFFFGPGSCLKVEFPIRTNKTMSTSSTDDMDNKSDDVNNKSEEEMSKENVQTTSDDDENGDDLLKKIDAVLDTENGEQDVDDSCNSLKEEDKSETNENASVNESHEITSDKLNEDSKSALEAFSKDGSENSNKDSTTSDCINSENKQQEEENQNISEVDKCETVNLSSECPNSDGNDDDDSNKINVDKKSIEETDNVSASFIETEMKPNEIESNKELLQSNVDNLSCGGSDEMPSSAEEKEPLKEESSINNESNENQSDIEPSNVEKSNELENEKSVDNIENLSSNNDNLTESVISKDDGEIALKEETQITESESTSCCSVLIDVKEENIVDDSHIEEASINEEISSNENNKPINEELVHDTCPKSPANEDTETEIKNEDSCVESTPQSDEISETSVEETVPHEDQQDECLSPPPTNDDDEKLPEIINEIKLDSENIESPKEENIEISIEGNDEALNESIENQQNIESNNDDDDESSEEKSCNENISVNNKTEESLELKNVIEPCNDEQQNIVDDQKKESSVEDVCDEQKIESCDEDVCTENENIVASSEIEQKINDKDQNNESISENVCIDEQTSIEPNDDSENVIDEPRSENLCQKLEIISDEEEQQIVENVSNENENIESLNEDECFQKIQSEEQSNEETHSNETKINESIIEEKIEEPQIEEVCTEQKSSDDDKNFENEKLEIESSIEKVSSESEIEENSVDNEPILENLNDNKLIESSQLSSKSPAQEEIEIKSPQPECSNEPSSPKTENLNIHVENENLISTTALDDDKIDQRTDECKVHNLSTQNVDNEKLDDEEQMSNDSEKEILELENKCEERESVDISVEINKDQSSMAEKLIDVIETQNSSQVEASECVDDDDEKEEEIVLKSTENESVSVDLKKEDAEKISDTHVEEEKEEFSYALSSVEVKQPIQPEATTIKDNDANKNEKTFEKEQNNDEDDDNMAAQKQINEPINEKSITEHDDAENLQSLENDDQSSDGVSEVETVCEPSIPSDSIKEISVVVEPVEESIQVDSKIEEQEHDSKPPVVAESKIPENESESENEDKRETLEIHENISTDEEEEEKEDSIPKLQTQKSFEVPTIEITLSEEIPENAEEQNENDSEFLSVPSSPTKDEIEQAKSPFEALNESSQSPTRNEEKLQPPVEKHIIESQLPENTNEKKISEHIEINVASENIQLPEGINEIQPSHDEQSVEAINEKETIPPSIEISSKIEVKKVYQRSESQTTSKLSSKIDEILSRIQVKKTKEPVREVKALSEKEHHSIESSSKDETRMNAEIVSKIDETESSHGFVEDLSKKEFHNIEIPSKVEVEVHQTQITPEIKLSHENVEDLSNKNLRHVSEPQVNKEFTQKIEEPQMNTEMISKIDEIKSSHGSVEDLSKKDISCNEISSKIHDLIEPQMTSKTISKVDEIQSLHENIDISNKEELNHKISPKVEVHQISESKSYSKINEIQIPRENVEDLSIEIQFKNEVQTQRQTEPVVEINEIQPANEIIEDLSTKKLSTTEISSQVDVQEQQVHENVEILNKKELSPIEVSQKVETHEIIQSPNKNVEISPPEIPSENETHVQQLQLTPETSSKVNEIAKQTDIFDKIKEKTPSQKKEAFQKPISTRKRKLSERKSISESDSDGGSNFVTDSVSNELQSEEEEEVVVTKKPRIRQKVTATRNTRATRQSAKVAATETKVKEPKTSPEKIERPRRSQDKNQETKIVNEKIEKPKVDEDKKPDVQIDEVKLSEVPKEDTEAEDKKDEEKTLQNFKFDYDENEDVVANVAAIKTLICKDPLKTSEMADESEDDDDEESTKKRTPKKGRKSKRGRFVKKIDAQESSSDDDESKSSQMPDTKRTKTSESKDDKTPTKKRESGGKGLLKYIDTSLVIETVETEAPIRQSRRIAQQKIREETERRQMEEKMLKQMKEEAERKKKGGSTSVAEPEEEENNDRSSDESYKGSKKKKKKKEKMKPSDRPWQTSSSHSEHTETEDEFEHPRSEDPGSPLFKSDHEFSPESDVDDTTTPIQPYKRARTAKKQVEESSDEEDVNPNHACQVCHKTDSPEWILLCDECDHGYHCSCLKPIIFCIPTGNWYCPLCCHKKLIDSLSVQLEKLDTLVHEIQAEEIRKQKQLEIKKLTEITEENILREKRMKRQERKLIEQQSRETRSRGSSDDNSESNDEGGNSSDNSSDNAPLNEIFYKLRRRTQATASYRFNDYDELINSAIRDEMEEVKGLGNAGRGKDISTIIEADKEEKKMQKLEKERAEAGDKTEEGEDQQKQDDDGESSGSEIGRPKKAMQRKKKNRKLNNLDETSEEDVVSDEDFKGTPSSNSDTEDEEDYSMSSVSESSLDLPLKKSKIGKRSTRSAAKNRRYDEKFINDNDSSDDEPLIKKRTKKIDSDEEEFDANDDDNSEGSTVDEIDSDDLCDDTDTDDSSEGNWPKKKKKRVASYDVKKPKRPAKKNDDDEDRAFRAGISKKKILKKSENESEGSDEDNVKGRRKTRGKKLLYLIEDDYESDDGIKPGIGVIRPETPPEEREMFVKKQEEIKRMLAAKNTEGARQLAVPTIEPIKLALEKPDSPSPPPAESSSLSTIPKNVIEGAKALDNDFNRLKPLQFGIHSKHSDGITGNQEMSEEELAKMMEEEDFAQHQLKLAGEAIARSNKLLELEGKEEAFAPFSKVNKLKEEKEKIPIQEPAKKRTRKPKAEKIANEAPLVASPPPHTLPISHHLTPTKPPLQSEPVPLNIPPTSHSSQQHIVQRPHLPPSQIHSPIIAESLNKPSTIPSIPPLIPNSPFSNISRFANHSQQLPPPHLQDRPSVLSNYISRHEGIPRHELIPPSSHHHQPLPPSSSQHLRFISHQPQLQSQLQSPPESFIHKTPPMPHLQSQTPITLQSQPPPPHTEEVEEKKKGRRKKYTPLRTDLPDSKVAKLDPQPTSSSSSVIQHSTLNLVAERVAVDEKIKGLPRTKTTVSIASAPQAFNPTAANPTPSVITRLLQPQQRPFGAGFPEQLNIPVTSSESSSQPPTSRTFPEDSKLHPASKQARPSNPALGPQAQFSENPFVPRGGMHPGLYRGPPTTQSIYGLPHTRIPYPFHHLHPNNNLRPNMQEYAPYNIPPPQFGYYGAPPAHTRQHPQNPSTAAAVPPALSHAISHHDDAPSNPNSRSNNNNNPSDEQPQHSESSSTSEFGGLVSYFSSQQELD